VGALSSLPGHAFVVVIDDVAATARPRTQITDLISVAESLLCPDRLSESSKIDLSDWCCRIAQPPTKLLAAVVEINYHNGTLGETAAERTTIAERTVATERTDSSRKHDHDSNDDRFIDTD